MLGSSGSFLVLVNKETTWLAWDAGKRKARRLRGANLCRGAAIGRDAVNYTAADIVQRS